VFFGKLGEIAGEYLRKGRPVYVEGRIKTRKWQGQDGQDRYTTEIIADQMQMLGNREGSGDPNMRGGSGADFNAPPPQRPAQTRATAPQVSAPANLEDMDDEIPF